MKGVLDFGKQLKREKNIWKSKNDPRDYDRFERSEPRFTRDFSKVPERQVSAHTSSYVSSVEHLPVDLMHPEFIMSR